MFRTGTPEIVTSFHHYTDALRYIVVHPCHWMEYTPKTLLGDY